MIRIAIVVLVLLAAAKIWTHEQIFRSAAEDALLQAYRAQAIAACRTASLPEQAAGTESASRQRLAAAFASSVRAHLEIGNQELSVPIWDVDHAAWAMRYAYPYIVLEAVEPAARCAYDVKLGRARVTLL